MRIDRILAPRFGPLLDKELELSPGMNLIWGPNESGKSTWHAALYVALCGMKRRKGQPEKVDRQFEQRHSPWDIGEWQVGLRITLDNGRRIELRRDLATKGSSSVVDADLGVDVSAEIIYEGSPDGSRWLGLDRRSFLAVSCVRQADIMNLDPENSSLTTYLQRAADTAGTEETASAAIERIENFKKENVGSDRIGGKKPLHLANEKRQEVQLALEQARKAHDHFVRLVRKANELSNQYEDANRRLKIQDALIATRLASDQQRRCERARILAKDFATGAPVLRDDDLLAQDVSSALQLWKRHPEIQLLEGPTAEQIHAQLASLPTLPEGDTEPFATVLDAEEKFRKALHAVQFQNNNRPADRAKQMQSQISESELFGIISDLETSVPEISLEVKKNHEQVMQNLKRIASPKAMIVGITVGVLLLGAGVALMFKEPLYAVLPLVLGIAILVLVAIRSHRRVSAQQELDRAKSSLEEQIFLHKSCLDQREKAVHKALALRLPSEPLALRNFAEQMAESKRAEENLLDWQQGLDRLSTELRQAEIRLRAALDSRKAPDARSLSQRLEIYKEACKKRAEIAQKASKVDMLRDQLSAREAAENAAIEALRQCDEALAGLKRVAILCGVPKSSEENIAVALENWLRAREAELVKNQEKLSEWSELQTLLDGSTIDQLKEKTRRSVREAELAKNRVKPEDLTLLNSDELTEPDELDELKNDVQRLHTQASEASALVENTESISVADAEEAFVRSDAELERVKCLEKTLDLTRDFLKTAGDRYHRDIARKLNSTIQPWLPLATDGRYDDIRVNPETLEVTVREQVSKKWRNAEFISHGAAELVYLLLRVGMAKHLCNVNDTSPLILDDVAAHFDSDRTYGVLHLLHMLSTERQIVLFSQKAEVRTWGERNLTNTSRDRIIFL